MTKCQIKNCRVKSAEKRLLIIFHHCFISRWVKPVYDVWMMDMDNVDPRSPPEEDLELESKQGFGMVRLLSTQIC